MCGRELLEWLQSLSDDQLDNFDITIKDNGPNEYYTLQWAFVSTETDIVDKDSPILYF